MSQALQAAACSQPRDATRDHILKTFIALCSIFAKNQMPYGILVGYVFQTGSAQEKHSFTDEAGNVSGYIMPRMKPDCKTRHDQFVDIASQGNITARGMLSGAGARKKG